MSRRLRPAADLRPGVRRAGAAPHRHFRPGRGGPPRGLREQRPRSAGPALARLHSLPRVLPRRHGRRVRRGPSDRLDRAGGPPARPPPRSPRMNATSGALVFFGATGDLAYKKVIPALYAMVKHGRLEVPVVGVARSGWTLEQMRQRAVASITAHADPDAGALQRFLGLLRYVDGDYADPATFAGV